MSKVKHCSKGYLFWCQTFGSLDIWISTEVSQILRKGKFHWENWHGRRVCFNEPVQVHKVGALLDRVIAKQQSKREQTHPVCLHILEKYKKVESINTQNDYKITSKKWADKKKTDFPHIKANRYFKPMFNRCLTNI